MKKRYAVLGLSVILALAFAVPAIGGPSNPVASLSASAKSTASKALKKAKAAQKTANRALSTANSANSAAGAANSAAGAADNAAKKAQTTADEAKSAAGAAQASADSAKGTADAAKATADTAKATADTAKSTADTAKTIAEEAKARALEGIRNSGLVIGTANPASGTNTTVTKSASAECPSDQEVLGGGFFVNGEDEEIAIHSSQPQVIYSNGWFAEGSAISGTPEWSIQVQVMCGIK